MSFIQHGVFLDMFGKGILITGKSGTGKSSLGLSLIDRGHALIADDVVLFSLQLNGTLLGCCPRDLKGQLHIHSLGLIDIKKNFGEKAIQSQQILSLIIYLTPDSLERDNLLEPKTDQYCLLEKTFPRVWLTAHSSELALLTEIAVKKIKEKEEAYA